MTSALGRGARLSRETLNAFLAAYLAPQVEGSIIYAENNEALTTPLRSVHSLDESCRVRIFIPYATHHPSPSSYVFVCWTWNFVLHAKEVESALLPAEKVPAGFEEAMQKIQRDAVIGVWCVLLRDEWGLLQDELADSLR